MPNLQNQRRPAAGGAQQPPNEHGIRARSTQVRHNDGSVSQVINIGVPADHPMADTESQPGPTGLYNMRMGAIRIPAAPQFVINVHRNRGENNVDLQVGNQPSTGSGGDQPNPEEQAQIDQQVERLTGAINRMLASF